MSKKPLMMVFSSMLLTVAASTFAVPPQSPPAPKSAGAIKPEEKVRTIVGMVKQYVPNETLVMRVGKNERTFKLDEAGIAVDLVANVQIGKEVSVTERVDSKGMKTLTIESYPPYRP